MKNYVIGIVAVLALIVSGAAYFSQPKVQLSGASGPDFYNAVHFYDTATIGGGVTATTSAGTATYTAANLANASLISHTASGALTATLPASTTLRNFAPKPGDVRTIFVAPVTTNITFAGGTGTNLDSASSTDVCVASAMCRLDFVRKSDSDFEVLFTTVGK
jgi:hypothetical protein